MNKAIFLLFALCLWLTAPLQAACWPIVGPYVGLGAGLDFIKKHHFSDHNQFRNGYIGTAIAGYAFFNRFRLETEFTYRYNKLKKVHGRKVNHGRYENYSAMANCLYQFVTPYYLIYYVGAGIGYDYDRIKTPRDDSEFHTRFAYQFIAGASMPYCDNVDIGVEYRFHSNHTKHQCQSVLLAVRRGF